MRVSLSDGTLLFREFYMLYYERIIASYDA
nr:MAG TPA_asm: hypothetical protein [Caudoviricetes sp.]